MPTLSGGATSVTMATSISERVEQVQSFLATQKKMRLDASFVDAMEATQASSLVNFIRASKIDLPEATRLVCKVSEGTFSSDRKQILVEAINEKLHTKTVRECPTQTCSHLTSYLTKSEWDALASKASTRLQRVRVLVDRMRKVGLVNPTEQTRKDAAIIVGLFEDAVGGKDLCDDVRFWLKKLKGHSGGPTLFHYPPSPSELENSVFAAAYGSEEPAPEGYVDLSRWSFVAGQLALRKTNKLCGQGAASQQPLLDTLRRNGTPPLSHLHAYSPGYNPSIWQPYLVGGSPPHFPCAPQQNMPWPSCSPCHSHTTAVDAQPSRGPEPRTPPAGVYCRKGSDVLEKGKECTAQQDPPPVDDKVFLVPCLRRREAHLHAHVSLCPLLPHVFPCCFHVLTRFLVPPEHSQAHTSIALHVHTAS